MANEGGDLTEDEKKVFEGLWKRSRFTSIAGMQERLTEQTLRLVDSQDEAERLRINENIGTLRAQIIMLRGEIQPATLSRLPNTDKEGAFYVFCRALQREIQRSDAVTEFDFGVSWWRSDAHGSAQKLWVRECYNALYENCLESQKNGQMKFLLEGTPGTGKSGFGLYCVIRFVRDGRLVWYRYREHAPMIFVGSDEAKTLFEKHIPDVVLSSGAVYSLDNSYTTKLEAIPNLVRIFDPESGSTVPAEGQLFDVIVSSPDTVKLSEIRKLQTTSIRYLPLWTLDELEHIREYHAYQHGTNWLKLQFERFGGTPRIIFDREGDSKLRTAIQVAATDDLRGFFDKVQKGKSLPLVVHMKPNENFTSFEYKIATDRVGELLVQAFTRSLQTDLEWWLAACRDDPEMATTRGKLKEHQWHRRIVQGGRMLFRPLGSHKFPRIGTPKVLTLPALQLSNFPSLEDIETLHPLVYYRPTISNFKTFDSFAILPEQVFSGDAHDSNVLLIVGFQMTVSRRHPLLKSGIEDLEKKIRSQITCADSVYIVFVSEPYTGVKEAQKLKHDNENSYADGSKLKEMSYPQFVITGIEF